MTPTHLQTRRWLVSLGAVLYGFSLVFPLTAGFAGADPPPAWLGPLDVAVAIALLGALGWIATTGGKLVNSRVQLLSFRIYRVLANLPLILIAGFFLLRPSIKWDVLVVGLAWRTWAIMYVLPAGLALWGEHLPALPVPEEAALGGT